MRLLLFTFLLLGYASVTQAAFNLRMKYVGATNTPNLDVRWHGSENYFGYQNWNVGAADIYTPNETRELLGISDSVLPVDGNTFVVQWAIAGSGDWHDSGTAVLVPRGGDSGVMEWTLGLPPPPPVYVKCEFINYSQCYQTQWVVQVDTDALLWTQIVPPLTKTPIVKVLGPYDLPFPWMVETESECAPGILTEWQMGTNGFSNSSSPPTGVSATNGAPFLPPITGNTPDTTNITFSTNSSVAARDQTLQEGFSATRSTIDQSGQKTVAAVNAVKAVLDGMSSRVSTNGNPASGSEIGQGTNIANGMSMNVSNGVAGFFGGKGTEVNDGFQTLGTVYSGSPLPISFTLLGSSIVVNPFSNTHLSALASFIQALIRWIVKLLLGYYLFQWWQKCSFKIATAASGVSTSGWLQAFPISTGQLLSSLGGVAAKWVAVVVALGVTYVTFTSWLAFSGTSYSLFQFISAMPEVVRVGWSLVEAIVPFGDIFAAIGIYITGVVSMLGVTIGGIAVCDAAGKA